MCVIEIRQELPSGSMEAIVTQNEHSCFRVIHSVK